MECNTARVRFNLLVELTAVLLWMEVVQRRDALSERREQDMFRNESNDPIFSIPN